MGYKRRGGPTQRDIKGGIKGEGDPTQRCRKREGDPIQRGIKVEGILHKGV